jgi:hypothetical protein
MQEEEGIKGVREVLTVFTFLFLFKCKVHLNQVIWKGGF